MTKRCRFTAEFKAEFKALAALDALRGDKTVDLRQLDTLDLIAVYWMGDAIAHTILSFGFAGEQIAVSIETRK